MTRVCMGGTFDVLHRGHHALLETAFKAADEGVFIGVTSDAMAHASRERVVRSFETRVARLKEFLADHGWLDRATIREITEPFGAEASLSAEYDAIAVTVETASTAERINEAREERGMQPLKVLLAPYILAEDGRPIKATRVRHGEVDEAGHLLRPPVVAVGSANPVKVEAVRRVFQRYWPDADVRGVDVPSKVPEQPVGDETWVGAEARARGALIAVQDADFGVGVEAGLLPHAPGGGLFDVQACAILDHADRFTHGEGPGFAYPPEVERAVREGGETVGDVMSRVARVEDIGRKIGAVGYLSRGVLDRTALTEPAVLMALLPRLHPALYGLDRARP